MEAGEMGGSRAIVFAALAAVPLFQVGVAGTRYDVALSRKSSNVYEVPGGNIRVLTRSCYEYAYSENSLLDWDGQGGYVIFLDQGRKCDVRLVVSVVEVRVGKYDVHVTRENDDWFTLDGLNLFVSTSFCLEFAYSKEAVLRWRGIGGELIFLDSGRKCNVENIWGSSK